MHNTNITVIGDGGWGTTLAILLFNKGYNCILWSAFPDYAKVLDGKRENKKFLPGIKLPKGLVVTSRAKDVANRDYYILAVPCQYLRNILKGFRGIINKPIVSVVKGIENGSLKRPAEIILEVFGKIQIAGLSGPTIAYEVARGIPTICVISAKDNALARDLQGIFSTERLRVYTSEDIVGAEVGGALKNIIAIAAGISDGMGFGVNTKAAILTRGLVEIARLGQKMGARRESFEPWAVSYVGRGP